MEADHYRRIMLKFRPIAPKPAGGANPSLHPDQERRNGKRAKRKYVRVRRRQTTKRKSTEEGRSEKSGVDDGPRPEKSAVTLQLLPERSESEKSCCSSALKSREMVDRDRFRIGSEVYYGGMAAAAVTLIVVERVTDTYVDGGLGLGFSDGDMIENLRGDTCPGFISDGGNNVVWVNEAYRRMEAAREVAVRLEVREKLPYSTPSFACRVRMIQQTKQGQKWNRIVACDVWRMEFAGFAWKLDVQTALGLGI